MRILLVLHGYPPDDGDAIARAARAEARALAARGHQVTVVAGTVARDGGEARLHDREPGSGNPIEVLRLSRSDLHPEHWQKSASSSIPARFRRALREIEPDLVHVHHWRRLSRDLVASASAERVPALVRLHDHWTTCLLGTRTRPADGTDCDASFAPMPCLACAGSVPPRTPFVPLDQLFLAFGSHRAELARELVLARAVLAGSAELAERIARFLPAEARAARIEVAADVAALERASEGAIALGPSDAPTDVDAWYAPRMRAFLEEHWDRSLAACSPRELGYDAP